MSFDIVSKEIVSESINNAVCIDNKFHEPFTPISNPEEAEFKIPHELYNSFRKERCVLDVYRYKDFEQWNSIRASILEGKDLLILDWNLKEGGIEFEDSLKVLNDAIKMDSLPFVYIYTDEEDLSDIFLHMQSFFSGFSKSEVDKHLEDLSNKIEDVFENIDSRKLLHGLKSNLKDILIYSDRVSETKKQIFSDFKKLYEDMAGESVGGSYGAFLRMGKEIFSLKHDLDFLTNLGLCLNMNYFPEYPIKNIKVQSIEGEENSYLINNTLVKISTKKMMHPESSGPNYISADELFSDFSQTICKRPRNFLALLGLEMRNLFRNGSSIIGKDINEIDQFAFFHHQETEPELFNEFLQNYWENEISAYLLDQKVKLFTVLDNYKLENNIEKELINFRENNACFHENLARLNYYYSMIRYNREHKKISFGDIFKLEIDKDKGSSDKTLDFGFILCITPHCDCLRPKKVYNNFHFTGGNIIPLKNGLEKGDSGFISFLKSEGELICIEWINKPFTIYIPNSENNVEIPIKCEINKKNVQIIHFCCQKENYTQRIANQAFGFAQRVGIEFAKIIEKEGKGDN